MTDDSRRVAWSPAAAATSGPRPRRHAEDGFDVAVNYRRDGEAEKAGARAIAYRADVAFCQEDAELVDRVVVDFGRLDVLVCNAGIDAALWLSSLVRSQRWTDLTHKPRIAVVVDAGTEYWELRGVEISGRAETVGDVPRTMALYPDLAEPERLFARKYRGTDEFTPDGPHGWLRIRPEKLTSWDFRKSPALRSPAP